MTRLLDADKLKHDLEWLDSDRPVYNDVMSTIDEVPTVDAEPVVRCKDCKHYWDSAGMCCFADMPINDSVKTEDYCSRGERREDE